MKWRKITRGQTTCDFGGRIFAIYRLGLFRYKLWCYDISESYHWTLWGAKRQAVIDALEYCMRKGATEK